MLEVREIQAIARRLQRSGLETIEIKGDGYALRLTCDARLRPQPVLAASPPAPDSPPPATVSAVAAPMPGRVWLDDPLTGRRIAADERTVRAGDLLALLQVGPLCLPLRAESDGRLEAFTVAQGQPVEFGQPVAHIITTEAADERYRS